MRRDVHRWQRTHHADHPIHLPLHISYLILHLRISLDGSRGVRFPRLLVDHPLRIQRNKGGIKSIAFSPHGAQLATGGFDHSWSIHICIFLFFY